MNTTSPTVAAVGRLLIALIFLLSGVGKIFSPAATQAYIAAAGLPAPMLAYVISVVVEVGGGLLLVLGYRTRIVAWVLVVFSIVAALGFHHDFSNQDQMIHFMKNLAMAGGLLQVAAFGGGALSIDGRRGSSTARAI